MKHWLYIAIFSFICSYSHGQDSDFQKTLDSIQLLRELGKGNRIDFATKLEYAKKDSILSCGLQMDSLIVWSYSKLASLYSLKGEHHKSILLNKQVLKLGQQTRDSLALGIANASIAHGFYEQGIESDSAYYYYMKSIKYFEKTKPIYVAQALLLISELQEDVRDYISSDTTTIKAIELIKKLPTNNKNLETLAASYNQLGDNSTNLKLYEKAKKYFEKAISIVNQISPDYYLYGYSYSEKELSYLYAKINLAEVYRDTKEPQKALSIYKELLKKNSPFNKDSLYKKDPLTYAAVINNMAYCHFLGKTMNHGNISNLFNQAYRISDSLNANYERAAAGNDMAEFYHAIGKMDSAKISAERSYGYGKKIKDFYEVSRSLLLLSKLEEGDVGKKYLYEYIKLNDSLLDVERASRNKFARIKFETDTYIQESKKLNTQNILFIVIGLILVFVLALLYIIRIQIGRNQKLAFAGKQLKANEKIYGLIMRQQSMVEESRLAERHLIGEELNDGVLNKLVGSRLGLEFLSIDESPIDEKKYKRLIKELRNAEKDIRDISHNLKKTYPDDNKDYIELIEDYLSKQSEIHPLEYQIRLKNIIYWQDVPDTIKVNIFRIIQEVTRGTIKHSKGKFLILIFSFKANKNLHLEIINKTGFSSKYIKRSRRFKNIESVVKKHQGFFSIVSKVKTGTTLSIELPTKAKPQ